MVPDILLGAGVPRLVSGLGTSFLLLCLFGFEILRGSRACWVGVLHFHLFPFLPFLTLRTSIGPGRSSVLRIGSNPVEASSSGRTNKGNDSLTMVVHRLPRGSLLFPWIRAREKLTKFGILAALNI